MTFSPDQMRAVAEKVYPGKTADMRDDRVWLHTAKRFGSTMVPFSPSLTGNEREQSQALQCIVAAFKLGVLTTAIREHYIQGNDERYFFQVENQMGSIVASVKGADLLTASIAALLASTPSAVENV